MVELDEIFPKQYQWSDQLPKERQTGNWLNMPYLQEKTQLDMVWTKKPTLCQQMSL